MVTSVKELKQRLATFLADPGQEQEFRAWFALTLRDVHASNDPAVETLAHEIMWAFYDQERGLCTAAELMKELTRLATDSGVHFGPQGTEPPFSVRTGTTFTNLQEVPALVLGILWVGATHASESW